MCDLISQVHTLSRRGFLRRAAGLAGATATATTLGGYGSTALAQGIPQAAQSPLLARDSYNGVGTRLALLGTAGGPVWWADSDRHGIASAVAVDGNVYVVDCGNGVGSQLIKSGLITGNAPVTGLDGISGIFMTHLHSDHTTDYNNLMLYAWTDTPGEKTIPTHVYGPGNRGAMEPPFDGREQPAVINPENPTPGTVDMTKYLYQAFALDINDRMRASGKSALPRLIGANDITIPAASGYHPNDNPAPNNMAPFKVYEDDRVRVTATLVYHFPIAPAFAFRFDSDGGSIVFSGDTGPSQNLVRLAKGADILVHEVIDQSWIDSIFEPGKPQTEGLRQHMLKAHTSNLQVGKIAEAAEVGTLVLSHIVPADAPHANLMKAQDDFSGQVVVGEDLMQFDLGAKHKTN